MKMDMDLLQELYGDRICDITKVEGELKDIIIHYDAKAWVYEFDSGDVYITPFKEIKPNDYTFNGLTESMEGDA